MATAVKTLGDVGAGHVLGRYELLMPIATGGMATVWAARMKGSRGFQKIVAIKTMLPSVSDDPLFEQMFLDEATLASSIRHPNVAEIFELGEQNGVLFLAMEWVDGESLSVLMKAAQKRQKAMALPVAIRIAMDVCEGLHAAHELRDDAGRPLDVVHRDVSPQNILVTFDGVVKIVDFGVAKAQGRAGSQTTAGQIKGKAAYMAPEQARGGAIDRRTDLFAVGILLYQMTTFHHPFRGENDMATLLNICSDAPVDPPSRRAAEYPASLENVIMKALAKVPADRYATARELHRALEVVSREVGMARVEEVADLILDLLGDRQGKRHEFLQTALRLADARAEARLPGDSERPTHSGLVSLGRSPSDSGLRPADASTRPSNAPTAMVGALSQPPDEDPTVRHRRTRRVRALVAAAVALLLGAAIYKLVEPPAERRPAPANARIESGNSKLPAPEPAVSIASEAVTTTPSASATPGSSESSSASSAGPFRWVRPVKPRGAPTPLGTASGFVAPVRNPGF